MKKVTSLVFIVLSVFLFSQETSINSESTENFVEQMAEFPNGGAENFRNLRPNGFPLKSTIKMLDIDFGYL